MFLDFSIRRRQWQPTPVLLPGKSHGQRSLVGCSPWGRWGLDITERLHFHFAALEKEMATHSSVLAWRIPGTGELGGLPTLGSHRVRHDWSDLAAAAADFSIAVAGRYQTPRHSPLAFTVWLGASYSVLLILTSVSHLCSGHGTRAHFLMLSKG